MLLQELEDVRRRCDRIARHEAAARHHEAEAGGLVAGHQEAFTDFAALELEISPRAGEAQSVGELEAQIQGLQVLIDDGVAETLEAASEGAAHLVVGDAEHAGHYTRRDTVLVEDAPEAPHRDPPERDGKGVTFLRDQTLGHRPFGLVVEENRVGPQAMAVAAQPLFVHQDRDLQVVANDKAFTGAGAQARAGPPAFDAREHIALGVDAHAAVAEHLAQHVGHGERTVAPLSGDDDIDVVDHDRVSHP